MSSVHGQRQPPPPQNKRTRSEADPPPKKRGRVLRVLVKIKQGLYGIPGGEGSRGTALIHCELRHPRTMGSDKVHNLQHLSFLNVMKGTAAVCLSDPLQAFLLIL